MSPEQLREEYRTWYQAALDRRYREYNPFAADGWRKPDVLAPKPDQITDEQLEAWRRKRDGAPS